MDWSEWHPGGTVALDWLPFVMIAAGLYHFGTKGIITLDPPFVPTVCQQIVNFTRSGGLGLLLPWSLTNTGLWPHTPDVYTNYVVTNYVATELSGTKNTQWHSSGRVANNWQSGCPLVKWTQFWSKWQWIGLSGIPVLHTPLLKKKFAALNPHLPALGF